MLAYLLGIQFGDFTFRYSYIALVAAGFIALFEVLMLFTYETPRWLFKKNLDYDGIRVLKVLRGPNFQISTEIDVIKAGLRRTYSIKEQLLEFRNRAVYHPFILVLILMFFQQFSGINAVIFYASTVFSQAGYNPQLANIVTFGAIGVVQVIATVFSVILVDSWGRRKLLVLSSFLMALSSFTLGIYYLIFTRTCHSILKDPCPRHIEYMAILSVVVFIIGFSLGWGPIPWSSMSELLPTQVRTLGGSIATFANWGFAVIITLVFPTVSTKIAPEIVWWIFAVIMVVGIVFVVLFLPEAKGHTLEEIQEYFEKGNVLACSCGTRRRNRSGTNFSTMRDTSAYTPTSSLQVATRENSSVN